MTTNQGSASHRPLEDDARQMAILIDSVVDYAIYMLDPEGYIRSWNKGGRRIKGYESDAVLGRHYRMFYSAEDQAAGLPERNLAIAREAGTYNGEGWRVRSDGSRFWASVVIDAVFDGDELIGFAKITRDITERFQAQKELEHAHQAMIASQRMEAVGRLTLGIAHDFNNLLGVIINAMELAAIKAGDNPKLRELIATADQAADRGALLTRQLLAFARAQSLSPTRASLSDLIARSADLYRRACGPNTTCQLDLAANLPESDVDEAQLEAAVLNLVVNAADAMDAGGVIRIGTGTTVDTAPGLAALAGPHAYAYVEVADTGHGMGPEVLAKAAEPFFTTKEVGKGSGLGLSQVHGFLSQSGGFMRISSEVAVGTTVRLHFPLSYGHGHPAHPAG